MKRSVLRHIARYNMKKAGLKKFCKHSYIHTDAGTYRISSYFAENWRNYIPKEA